MRPTRGVLPSVVLLLTLTAPVLAACGSPAGPGGSTSAPPTVTAPSATPSPTPTASPTPFTTPSLGAQWTVVSARVAYAWRWPGGSVEATVGHATTVPPVPQLVTIGAADHPKEPSDRPYNRVSFSFTSGYPSYRFMYVAKLVADGSGQSIPLDGLGVLRIVFSPAQAHTTDGTASSILSQPPAHLGLSRMVAYAQAGDFEGYLIYGIGITYPNPQSNPQIQVRVYEVTYINGLGDHRYVVAFDVDAR